MYFILSTLCIQPSLFLFLSIYTQCDWSLWVVLRAISYESPFLTACQTVSVVHIHENVSELSVTGGLFDCQDKGWGQEWVPVWGKSWGYGWRFEGYLQAMRTWALRLLVVPAELQATHWHQKSSGPNSSSTCCRVISILASRTTKPAEWREKKVSTQARYRSRTNTSLGQRDGTFKTQSQSHLREIIAW